MFIFPSRLRKLLKGNDSTSLDFLSLFSKSQVHHNKVNKCLMKDEEETELSTRAFTRMQDLTILFNSHIYVPH